MKISEAGAIGIIMGCLYGIVLWASMDALKLASKILYNDPYYIPFETVIFVMLVAFGALFTYEFWYPNIEEFIFQDWETIDPLDDEEKDDDDE